MPVSNSVSILAALAEAPNIVGGSIQFRDPWFIDYADTSYGMNVRNRGMENAATYSRPVGTAGFKPDTTTQFAEGKYLGVFLNQGGPPNWNTNPTYAVNALGSQIIGGFTGYFLNWSGDTSRVRFQDSTSPATGVLFKQSGASPTALYKGHLLSNQPQGFNTNSQRKLVRDETGRYHAVYASLGNVWYTYSNDNGSTWQPEIRVNPTDCQGKSPSITAGLDGTNRVYVSYVTDKVGGQVRPSIMLGSIVAGQVQWLQSMVVLSGFTYDPAPAVAAKGNACKIVYKCASTSPLSVAQVALANGTISYSYSAQVSGTDASSTNPSIAYSLSGSGIASMAYQQGSSSIRYIEWNGENQSLPVDISSGDGCSLNTLPSVAVHSLEGPGTETPIVSWTGNTPFTVAAIVRRRVSGAWSSFTQLGGYVQGATQVGATSSAGNQAIVGWVNTTPTIKPQFSRLVNGTFESPRNLPSTGQFHITSAPTFASMKSLLFNTSVVPFQILPLSYNYQTLAKDEGNSAHWGRGAVLEKNGLEVGYFLEDVMVDGTPVAFKPFRDTVQIKTPLLLDSALWSEPFHLDGNSSLSFSSSPVMLNASQSTAIPEVQCKVELVSSATGRVVDVFGRICFGSTASVDTAGEKMDVDCSNIVAGSYMLHLDVQSTDSVSLNAIEITCEPASSLSKLAHKKIVASGGFLPRHTAIRPAYPNPFNPTTTLSYDLAADAQVRLVIYDILGRVIATLESGFRSAGRHSVIWDGKNVSSGTYLVRFEAVDPGGQLLLAKSEKVVLMK